MIISKIERGRAKKEKKRQVRRNGKREEERWKILQSKGRKDRSGTYGGERETEIEQEKREAGKQRGSNTRREKRRKKKDKIGEKFM